MAQLVTAVAFLPKMQRRSLTAQEDQAPAPKTQGQGAGRKAGTLPQPEGDSKDRTQNAVHDPGLTLGSEERKTGKKKKKLVIEYHWEN